MATQRYKLTVAYRGTAYHGWQSQLLTDTYTGPTPRPGQGIPTIQETLAAAVASVVRHPVELVGSSRTDAGVHAKGQVAHFDTDQLQIPPDGLRRAVNSALPQDITVRTLEPAASDFDAIRSTTSKRYQYAIWNHTHRPTLFPDLAWHRWHSLDVEAMRDAARRLIGEHDFASFAKPGHGRLNTVRTILGCDVSRRGALVVVGVEGTGFLWNMVRIIVGTLVEVGLGRLPADDLDRILAAKDRSAAGPTAPPHGLYLQWIKTRDESVQQIPAPSSPLAASPITPSSITLRSHHGQYVPQILDIARLRGGIDLKLLEFDARYTRGFLAFDRAQPVGFLLFRVENGLPFASHLVGEGEVEHLLRARLESELRRHDR